MGLFKNLAVKYQEPDPPRRTPGSSGKKADRFESTVVHKPSDEGEYWLSQTPRLLAQIRREHGNK